MNTHELGKISLCAPRKGRGRAYRLSAVAFTLAELIVSAVILTMVVGATTIAVSQIMRSRDKATASGEAFSRAQLAAQRIATDAGSALRDADLNYGKVTITRGGPAGKTAQGLLIFAHQNRPVRGGGEAGVPADSPESDEYEVQFRLEPAPAMKGSAISLFTLWRRADPVPDDYFDGGGIAAPVVDGLTSLTIDAYDGTSWKPDWDSDVDGYPHALRIVVSASDDNGKRTATARRVVAFDRTPVPLPEPEEETDTGSTTTGGSGA